jgi:hypothetical protein
MTFYYPTVKLGSLDLSDIVDRDRYISVSGGKNYNSLKWPGNHKKTKSVMAGSDPLRFQIYLASPDQDVIEEAVAAFQDCPRGEQFWPGKTDRYVLIDGATAIPDDDIPSVVEADGVYYTAKAEVWAQNPYYYSTTFQYLDSETFGDFGEVTNAGSFDAPLASLWVQGGYDGSSLFLSPTLIHYQSDHVTTISPAITFATFLHTDESIEYMPLINRFRHRYIDQMVDPLKTARDITTSGTITYGTSYTLIHGASAYIAYTFFSDYPISSPPILRTTISGDTGYAKMWYQTEVMNDWKEGPEYVTNTPGTFFFPGAVGKKNFTLVFSTSSASYDMRVYGVDIQIDRYISDDQIPLFSRYIPQSWSIISAGGESVSSAGRFHHLYWR